MPAARARTWATRDASNRPGSSVTSPTSPNLTVTTPTSGGGMPPPGPPPGLPAAPAAGGPLALLPPAPAAPALLSSLLQPAQRRDQHRSNEQHRRSSHGRSRSAPHHGGIEPQASGGAKKSRSWEHFSVTSAEIALDCLCKADPLTAMTIRFIASRLPSQATIGHKWARRKRCTLYVGAQSCSAEAVVCWRCPRLCSSTLRSAISSTSTCTGTYIHGVQSSGLLDAFDRLCCGA